MKTILFLLGMAWAVHSAATKAAASRSRVAPAPLYQDPVHDGAADATLIWNRAEKCWWMLIYFVHQAEKEPAYRHTWLQIAQLGFDGNTLTCDRDAEIEIDMKEPAPEFTAEHIPSIRTAPDGVPVVRKPIRNFTVWRDTDGNPISCHDGGITTVGDNFYWYLEESNTLFAMCDQWFRGPQDDRVPIDESLQLWLPVTFYPQTGVARMQRIKEWEPFGPR